MHMRPTLIYLLLTLGILVLFAISPINLENDFFSFSSRPNLFQGFWLHTFLK